MKLNDIYRRRNLWLILISIFSPGFIALAQPQFTDNLSRAKGLVLTVEVLVNMISGLACQFLRFGIIAVGVMMIIYGILFVLSRGNAQSFSEARRALTWGIVGTLVIMGVFTIILSVPAILSSLGLDVQSNPIDIISCS